MLKYLIAIITGNLIGHSILFGLANVLAWKMLLPPITLKIFLERHFDGSLSPFIFIFVFTILSIYVKKFLMWSEKIKRILVNIKFIFIPSYWIMNKPYSKEWDRELNQLMKENDFKQAKIPIGSLTHICKYEAQLGNKRIWVEHHPYASFISEDKKVRPSRQTIYLANKKLQADKKKPDWCDDKQKRRNRVLEQLGIT